MWGERQRGKRQNAKAKLGENLRRQKVSRFSVERHNSLRILLCLILQPSARQGCDAQRTRDERRRRKLFGSVELCKYLKASSIHLARRPIKIIYFFTAHNNLCFGEEDFVMISNTWFLFFFRYLIRRAAFPSKYNHDTYAQTLNYVHQYVPKGTTYFDKTIRIDKNPIKTALNVCKHLISKRVYAVVVSHDEKDSSGHDLSPAAVSYTSGFYQIPVIGISSRDAAFSDKNIHVSFLRTVPPYYHQADVWLEMLSHFGYTKACSKLLFCLRTPFQTDVFGQHLLTCIFAENLDNKWNFKILKSFIISSH